MASIFISHSHADWRLAQRLQSLLEQSSGRALQVDRSSESGAIKSGENWRDWIDQRVLTCDLAVVVLTPSSFRGRWVLWEAGAVAGVQYERLKDVKRDSKDPLARRVRVVTFNVTNENLGPFANTQVVDGLKAEPMIAFISEILGEYLGVAAATKGLITLKEEVERFVKAAADDLRYTPIEVNEGLVQDWLGRLDERSEAKDYTWIVAAKRWINVAFLGAGRANAHVGNDGGAGEAIDFRIHMRIASAHRRLGEWPSVVEQLRLAAKLSPNDMVVLRDLGRAQRELKDHTGLEASMGQMEQLDPDVFKKDREGIALRCGYLTNLGSWAKAAELLSNADPRVVNADPYLLNWYAMCVLKTSGGGPSLPIFRELKALISKTKSNFWDEATLMNAHLALDELADAEALFAKLSLKSRSKDELQSATRFFDEILTAFGRSFDWRKSAGLLPED